MRFQYGILCLPGGRIAAGGLAWKSKPGKAPKRVPHDRTKSYQYYQQYVVRGFNIINPGKFGLSARSILTDLAQIKRKRLGNHRAKSVDTQVKAWARRFALQIARDSASSLNSHYQKVQRAAAARLRDVQADQDAAPQEEGAGAQAEVKPVDDAAGVGADGVVDADAAVGGDGKQGPDITATAANPGGGDGEAEAPASADDLFAGEEFSGLLIDDFRAGGSAAAAEEAPGISQPDVAAGE